ncbi:MAG: nucleotidyltransferase family protein [Rhizobiaceae bacterium]
MRPSEALEGRREQARELIARYPVANPRIFGSVARGEDTDRSDIDILVERIGPMSYFDLFQLEDELASLFGCKVEVFTKLKPHAAASAARDMKAL